MYSAHYWHDGNIRQVGQFTNLDDARAALIKAGASGELQRTGTMEYCFIPSTGDRTFVVSVCDGMPSTRHPKANCYV